MKQATGRVKIGKYVFTKFELVKIESSYETLTDTCTIQVPRKLIVSGARNDRGETLFKKGDTVTVQLGYNHNNKDVFLGYVTKITAGENITFTCEDEMWKLKQKPVNKTYKSITLKTLLQELCPGTPIETEDINLGSMRFTQTTVSKVMEFLSSEYGLRFWFRYGTLYGGLAVKPVLSQTHTYKFTKNVLEDSGLAFHTAEDTPIEVRAISILPDNSRIQVTKGTSGEIRTIHKYNATKATLEVFAEEYLKKNTYTGMSGSFLAPGVPEALHGDVCKLIDKENPERNGKYFIRSVTIESGTGGYFRTINLASKA